jgi:hypothetical protein
MSTDDPLKKGQDFLHIVTKAKEFTEELLKERAPSQPVVAPGPWGGVPAASEDRSGGCSAGSGRLEERRPRLRRYRKVEDENKEFADRYIEIEEQNNSGQPLRGLYHPLDLDYKSNPDRPEIVINSSGRVAAVWRRRPAPRGRTSEARCRDEPRSPGAGSATPPGPGGFCGVGGPPRPLPSGAAGGDPKIKDSVIGVIAINKLLFQKTAFTTMDYELFTLLAGHAATAIFSAKLYSASARKLTTLQGFLDMLKTQPK